MTRAEETALRAELVSVMPKLFRFGMSLTRDTVKALDLAQETAVRALDKLDHFQPGTNFEAWLFTILRNSFLSDLRKSRREVEDPDCLIAQSIPVSGGQDSHVRLRQVGEILSGAPAGQRDAFVGVTVYGVEYSVMAEKLGVAMGTVKSRTNRVRNQIREQLAE